MSVVRATPKSHGMARTGYGDLDLRGEKMGRGTIYPEEWDYAWLDDYDRVMKNSKFVSGTRRASDIPPAPLSLVISIMKEMTRYEEIMNA